MENSSKFSKHRENGCNLKHNDNNTMEAIMADETTRNY